MFNVYNLPILFSKIVIVVILKYKYVYPNEIKSKFWYNLLLLLNSLLLNIVYYVILN